MPRVIVVGGGIAGLATAHHLLAQRPDLDVLVIDAGETPGGKIRGVEVGGVTVDVGAESIVASSAPARQLITDLGLAERLVHPEPVPATIWSRGARHRVPARSYLGIPSAGTDPGGILDEGEAARAAEPAPFAIDGVDVSVAEAVGSVYGRAVVDRVVEPLLGGVYAGRVDALSLRATMPGLWTTMDEGRSMPEAVASLLPDPTTPAKPRVMGLAGGLSTLVDALGSGVAAAGGTILRGTLARELHRTPTGWRVVTGPTIDPVAHDADAVVLATPAAPTSRLLADHAPAAARALAAVEYASMAVVTLALPTALLPPLPGSGFLAPAIDGHTIKAATFSASKWAWVAAASCEVTLLRASIGRAGEVASLQCSDEQLRAIALDEVGQALGVRLPAPLDAHVQRWGGGLPQYDLGHTDRVATTRADVAGLPGIELVGAAYDGVGIAAVLDGAARAASTIPIPCPPSSTTRQEQR
ncbi:protoporphyrinogen oxidase [Janibacter alittae]|uniref:Coproporphyrinogen III oxidase n=1 Tax=Janibacter alittae TaxID=3115209 RepID=A0ABZ2ML68_9MICO